jgi:hypothetical protein
VPVASQPHLDSGSSPVIHHHIDLGTVLRGAVCSLYSNLVTRPTGAAVRGEIERAVAEVGARTVTVVDFSQVTLLDYSCADEIVAKLMLRWTDVGAGAGTGEGYFVFRGLAEHHLDAVEAVLERHRLAIVALFGDEPALVGEVSPDERAAWEVLRALGSADAAGLAGASGLDPGDAAALLEELARRRLVLRLDGRYTALGGTLPPIPGAPNAQGGGAAA